VADAFGRMLNDSAVLDQFVQDNRTVAEKVLDVVRDIINAVQRALNDQNLKLSKNQIAEFRDLQNQMTGMEQLFSDALNRVQGATKNTATEGGGAKYSKKLGGFADVSVDVASELDFYGIKSINDYIGVQKTVYDKLLNSGFLDEGTKRRSVENADTGIVVEIGRDGIKETFGPGERYARLPAELKRLKIATVRQLPEIIKYGELVDSGVPNQHNSNSDLHYTYIQHPVTIGNKQYHVVIDIRQSRQTNKFWVHGVYVDAKKGQALDANADHTGSAINKDLTSNESVPRENAEVKQSKKGRAQLDEYITKYGAIPKGERPARDIQMPRQTSDTEKLSQTVRTVMEAAATPETMLPDIEQLAADGTFSFESYTDKQAIQDAADKIGGANGKGWTRAYSEWSGMRSSRTRICPTKEMLKCNRQDGYQTVRPVDCLLTSRFRLQPSNRKQPDQVVISG